MKSEPAPAWPTVFWDVLHGAGQRHVTRREPSMSRCSCSGETRRRSDITPAEEGTLGDGKLVLLEPLLSPLTAGCQSGRTADSSLVLDEKRCFKRTKRILVDKTGSVGSLP